MKSKLLFLLSFLPLFSNCRQITIKGNVVNEEGSPVPAATISIKGTTNTTIANSKGEFILTGTAPYDTLIVSALGYQTATEPNNMRGLIAVTLKRKEASLGVGDTLPPLTISNLINHPVSEIHLSNLKGKLIILDFWGQYCSACIASFPKMDSLQTKFKNQVQMITISNFQKKEDLLATLAKYKSTKNLRLTAALQHKQLAALFPHQLVPHVVWINKEGIVAAVTGADYITENNILQALKNDVAHWPVKKDIVEFNYRLPLLGLAQKELPAPRFLYYSTLTATIAGIAAPNSITRDSTRGIAIAQHINTSLLQLCEIALNHPPDGTITLQVKDSSRFKWNGEELYADWFRANTYCYALVLPIQLSNTAIKQAVQADLLRWLDLLGVKITTLKKMEAGKEINTYIITDK